ncbi:MAG: DUF2304 domain-containing protein [Planctomycetes bacterium]|nr:DUF2304 domain-containing protein [Planctomycetota bacterium]
MIGVDGWALASELAPMHDRQRTVALLLAAGAIVLVFELVRRRKLREEYSWVWVAIAAVVATLALQQDLLLVVSRWIGASSPVSTLFFGALLFLMTLALQFSVRLSRLTQRHKTLGQRLALLEAELAERRERDLGTAPTKHSDEDVVA